MTDTGRTTLHRESAFRSLHTGPTRVAVSIEPYVLSPAERERLESALHPVRLTAVSGDGAPAEARDAEVLVTHDVPRDIKAWPNLRLVQLVSAGIDHLVGHPVWASRVPVATASGIAHVAIAQYVLAMVLNFAHHLPQAMRFAQTRVWPDRLALAGRPLRGMTACVLGYGSIGRECGRMLDAMGIRILAVNRTGQPTPDAGFNAWPGTGDPAGSIPVGWHATAHLNQALAESDFLIVAAPLNEGTRGVVDAVALTAMPRGGFVVVASRGGIVDENALAAALASGHLAGAAVDTLVHEPPDPSDPLFDALNLFLTPHISGVFVGYMDHVWSLVIRNVARMRADEPPLNLVHGDA